MKRVTEEDAGPRRQWSQRVGALSGLPALIQMLGAESSAVVDGAGLATGALDAPDNRIDYGAFGRLLELGAQRTGCSHFGLMAGRMCRIDDLGIVGRIVRHSASVGEALQGLVTYQHLHSEGGVMFATRHGATMEVGYGVYYPDIVGADQIHDWALALTFNVLRELCGSAWLPSEALVPHSKHADAVHYRNAFKVHTQFDSELCALRFPAFWLDRRVEGADPVARREALRAAHAGSEPDLLQQVYRALRKLLLNGCSSGDEVANALSMHRRTLNRRLQQQGRTFQQILDDVRCEAARQLLCYSDIPLDDIAASLGYAGVSPFMRSFRRWTGVTPGRLRQAATQDDGSGASAADPAVHPGGDGRIASPLGGRRTAYTDAATAHGAPPRFAATSFAQVPGLDTPLETQSPGGTRATRSPPWSSLGAQHALVTPNVPLRRLGARRGVRNP